MGVIKLEYVIRYSSQDFIYKAENLLDNAGSKPWLCSQQDKSGHLEAEFQLDKASCIDFIDLGNYGSSTVEIQVGKSSFQQSTNYVSFLPAVGLLTLADIKAGADRNSVYMFDKNSMNENNAEEKWDRIKVICCQPYTKKIQFGLSFLSMRNKDNISKLVIEDNFAIDRSYGRLPKCLSGNSPDAESLMTRGKRILNASKFKKNMHPIKSIGNIDEQLKEDAVNFLIACSGEAEEGNKSVKDYIKEFEQQCQRTLTFSEKYLFNDKFKVLFNNNGLVKKLHQNNSFLTDENKYPNLTNSSQVSTPNNCIKKNNYLLFNGRAQQNSWKRPAPVCIPGSIVSHSKKKFPNSPAVQYVKKDKQQGRIAKILVKEKTCIDSASSEFENLKKQNKQQEDSKAQIHNKISFTRPEDFIQPDGIQPSTSSGITFADCPLCRESFMSTEIEKHASTCGDPSEILELSNEDYFKCPFCTELFSESVINVHAEKCLNKY